ncbi:MAG: pseudouridine-5'-phosphate glycosidase [Candidatus Marinimicrobia bacterium]|jgi:pseudouridine-5'-phosphate glycosidase|nr:pseudouridine-5'-phosphate glycosidase [Candidatus Neomarinimicrobiota bacterium]MBT4145161.1 pseudouridine-5'-phosphate glycosidase [Candidatus Neomarinimicrobiota bacterium]MBT4176962.1 pseudouridine-5'-phosphate glycosidase [Candidatus Neomarinimicrobiota bacterium]MBT4593688.1 pseudouridine-5'-phosphate glycosidase [Candidatus Neomarinimicrobiota bacterium]MBT4990607.1 pseudouridine-5'-phosphate glycosidase [Candidatus Neomarinimicrobiota bacterium]
MNIKFSKPVKIALENSAPILALESTIIAHGMPYPDNLIFAEGAESLCKKLGVAPATIAIIKGEICVGLSKNQLTLIAKNKNVKKIARHEIGFAISQKWTGATTVSSTMHIAKQAGISVFATGGIGGVHRGSEYSFDVSQDLIALSQIPMIVVSAGAKAILDIPKTVELLETLGVPILGYKTKNFPAFYSRVSGVSLTLELKKPQDIVAFYFSHLKNGLSSAILLANPVPKPNEILAKKMEDSINVAIEKAKNLGVKGKQLTPFLLEQIRNETKGKSLKTNRVLALNNINLGARVALEVSKKPR